MRSFMDYIPHLMLFGDSNQGGCDGLDMWNVLGREEVEKFQGKT
jgi:hypothetical protein